MNTIFKILPKNLLSHFVGWAATIRLPFGLSRLVIYWFVDRYRVDLNEVDGHIAEYHTLSQFFVRKLKDGSRPIQEGVVSPVDGRVVQCGVIERDRLLQVKGKYYYLDGLLRDKLLADRFLNGHFVTIYLAPRDYHRVHCPCDGEIVESLLVEGTLWPVNEQSVSRIDNLFCVNERVTTIVRTAHGWVAVIKVGATNVGSIRTSYSTIRSNQEVSPFRERGNVVHQLLEPAHKVCKGDELAAFHLGSTVILLFQKETFQPNKFCAPDSVVKMGQSLGDFR